MKTKKILPDTNNIKAVLFANDPSGFALWQAVSRESSSKGSVAAVSPYENYTLNICADNIKQCSFENIAFFIENDADALTSLADKENISVLLFFAKTDWLLNDGRFINDASHSLGRLTMLLFSRFCLEKEGFEIVSEYACLKKQIAEFASLRGLGMDFVNWLNLKCSFVKICTFAYASATDNAIFCDEHVFLALEGKNASSELKSLAKNAEFVDDITPFFNIKENIFYGAIAVSAAYAILHNVENIYDFVTRKKLFKHMYIAVHEEFAPLCNASFERVQVFVMDMFNAFKNRYVDVKWRDIFSLSVKKFISLAPVAEQFYLQNQIPPKHITFAFFCILEVYQIYNIDDSFSKKFKQANIDDLLSDEGLFGCDLSFMASDIKKYQEMTQ